MSFSGSLSRFQFSLRWLLVAVTAVAVLLTMGVFPAGQALIGFLLAILLRGVIPTVAVVLAIYGSDDVRAFAIGAVVVCVPLPTAELGPVRIGSLVAGMISQLVAISICGLTAVAARHWLERHKDSGAK